MFYYCNACRKKYRWPAHLSKARGRCHMCGNSASPLHRVNSKYSLPKPKEGWEYEPPKMLQKEIDEEEENKEENDK